MFNKLNVNVLLCLCTVPVPVPVRVIVKTGLPVQYGTWVHVPAIDTSAQCVACLQCCFLCMEAVTGICILIAIDTVDYHVLHVCTSYTCYRYMLWYVYLYIHEVHMCTSFVNDTCLLGFSFQRSMVALAMLFLSSVLRFLGHLMVADIFRTLSIFFETVNRDIRHDKPCFRPENNDVFSMLVRHS